MRVYAIRTGHNLPEGAQPLWFVAPVKGENVDKNNGLVLEVRREELQTLCEKRARAHEERAAVHTRRGEVLKPLTMQNVNPAMVAGVLSAPTEDAELCPSSDEVISMAVTTTHDLQQHIQYAKERAKAHLAAAQWLRFVTLHLKQEAYTFQPDDTFLAYLVNTADDTAMPLQALCRRNYQ